MSTRKGAHERWEGFEYDRDGYPCGTYTWETFEGAITIGQEHRPGGGWLAPDGRFYRCPDGYHYGMARRLLRDMGVVLPEEYQDEPAGYLSDRLGWERIWDNGLALGRPVGDLTQAQLDKMFDLAVRHPSMGERLMDMLRARRRLDERDGAA
jgi:hypothetical protein